MQKRLSILLAVVVIAALAGDSLAAESRVQSDLIKSIGLFKNGLAYVTREIQIAKTGESVLADLPTPTHGSFWVESPEGVQIDVRVTEREQPVAASVVRLAKTLDGAKVTAHFKTEDIPAVSGTLKFVEADETDDSPQFGQNYQAATNRYGWYGSSIQGNNIPKPPGPFTYLTIETDKGPVMLEPALLSHIVAKAKDGSSAILSGNTLAAVIKPPKPQKKPVMVFNVKDLGGVNPGHGPKMLTLRVSYLTKGIAWAPSYRIDLTDDKQLTLVQKSVIKNELADIEDAELFLITGFPSLEFSGVESPLSVRTNWMQFFQQLTQAGNPNSSQNASMGQMVLTNNYVQPHSAPSMPVTPTGEGPDLHYQSIGRRTLALGDSLTISLPSAEADYSRIVEWIVPDNRDYRGHMNNHRNNQNSEKWHGVAWDSVLFKNPLKYPMTTGPAMVVADGKVLGQRTSYFISPGEGTTQHITKALSVRILTSEQEEPNTRKVVYIGGNDYHRTDVKGTLTARNQRAETIELVIRRRFSGKLIEADDEPESRLLAEGVYSVNQRNELNWTIKLKPGEERVLSYKYSVLVDR
jgi:hypothetical protein